MTKVCCCYQFVMNKMNEMNEMKEMKKNEMEENGMVEEVVVVVYN